MAGLKGDPLYFRDLCEPQPRVIEGNVLRKSGVTAMMDISDGLALSVHDMMKASHTGCRISSDLIPVIPDHPVEEALKYALYGGGDFELLFTVPKKNSRFLPASTKIIGEVITGREILLDENPLPAQGFRHHW
jgi:thiamine-monophosphate kinase